MSSSQWLRYSSLVKIYENKVKFSCTNKTLLDLIDNRFFFFTHSDRILQRTNSGLIVSHSVVEHAAMGILIEYLTRTDQNENLPKAATIVNLKDGSSTIIAVIFSGIADSYIGRFKMVFVSTLVYIALSPHSILV